MQLEDLQIGGETAFTLAGTAIAPRKGSAIFWNTTHRNGTVDHRVIHGTCPAVLGHRWEVNKWLYENDNVFKRGCGLDQNE